MNHTRTYAVVIALRQNGATGRNELQGILKFLSRGVCWNLIMPQTNEQLNSVLRSGSYDGVIIGALHDAETLELVARSSRPTVLIDVCAEGVEHRKENIVYILNDDVSIGKMAGQFLTGLGRFLSYAYVPTPENHDWSRLRGKAFSGFLERKKIACLTPRRDEDLKAFLARLPKPAAVLCAWDGRAQEILSVAKAAKIGIPRQISILGVDNDELVCENSHPAISSVRPDHLRLGIVAAESLVRLFKARGKAHTVKRLLRIPSVGIVERESTGYTEPVSSIIRRAEEYVRQHAAEALTPDGLAVALRVSRRLLFLRFREYSKVSVAELIRNTRLELLKARLLMNRSRPIAVLTRELGYPNDRQVKNLFRKHVGMSMRDWRNLHRTIVSH